MKGNTIFAYTVFRVGTCAVRDIQHLTLYQIDAYEDDESLEVKLLALWSNGPCNGFFYFNF